jgi:hypothetical protein
MGRTACTEPQCLYKGDLILYFYLLNTKMHTFQINVLIQFLASSTCLEHLVFINRKIICTRSFFKYVFHAVTLAA